MVGGDKVITAEANAIKDQAFISIAWRWVLPLALTGKGIELRGVDGEIIIDVQLAAGVELNSVVCSAISIA